MGILTRMLVADLAALAGCYAPAVRDCTVSCASRDDCVRGQLCGSDGYCAAPQMAGRCGGIVADAGLPDAAPLVSLRVQVTGRGNVIVEGRGTCSSLDPQHGDCTYDIPLHVTQRVDAVAIQQDHAFLGWTSMTCNGEGASCTFTMGAATNIAAKFAHK
jgi:hypothetical protein